MAKNKVLKLDVIKKEDAKVYNGVKRVDIKGYNLDIQKVFRPSDIMAMSQNMLKNLAWAQENDFDVTQLDMTGYGMLLIIKFFTSLEIPDDFSGQVQALKLLIDNDYFTPIVEAFDPEEVKKVEEHMQSILNNTEETLKRLQELQTDKETQQTEVN